MTPFAPPPWCQRRVRGGDGPRRCSVRWCRYHLGHQHQGHTCAQDVAARERQPAELAGFLGCDELEAEKLVQVSAASLRRRLPRAE